MMGHLRTIGTMIRAGWLFAVSYRTNMVFSIASLFFSVIPLYFIANSLNGMMKDKIQGEATQFFSFVLVGTLAFTFVSVALSALPGAVGGSIGSGMLETLLGVPTPLPVVMAGLTAYEFLWTGVRALLMLIAGWALGAHIHWLQLPFALLIIGLITLAYLPLGLLDTALRIAFRTSGPLMSGIIIASTLLGGVYYPPKVINVWWIEAIAHLVPLTYGLRALRKVLLEGAPLSAVAADLGILMIFVIVLSAGGALAMAWSLRYARRAGTLAQY